MESACEHHKFGRILLFLHEAKKNKSLLCVNLGRNVSSFYKDNILLLHDSKNRYKSIILRDHRFNCTTSTQKSVNPSNTSIRGATISFHIKLTGVIFIFTWMKKDILNISKLLQLPPSIIKNIYLQTKIVYSCSSHALRHKKFVYINYHHSYIY